nr:MAG TPA: hypothetical protein [Caudoviricetes sp.]
MTKVDNSVNKSKWYRGGNYMFDNIFLNLSSTNFVYLFFPNNSE